MPRQNHRSIHTGPSWIALFFVSFLFLSITTEAESAPPGTISFQALLDSAGTPLTGSHDLTFTMYDSIAAGISLWTESHPGVLVDDGVASVLLGSIAPLAGVSFENLRWLGISVGAGPEFAPRTAIGGAAYAFLSGDVAGGYARSVNGLQGDVRIVAGSNISVTEAGDSIVVSSAGAQSDGDWMITGNDLSSVPSGNVGMGTLTPGAKLDIQGTGPGGLGLRVNDALYVNGSSGFVGVGRSAGVTGSDLFSIRSLAGAGSYGGMYIDTDNVGARPFYGYATGGAARAWTYYDGATSKWHLDISGSKLTVQTDGKVGMGTTTPAERLEVTGNIAADGSTRMGEHPTAGANYAAFWRDGNDYAFLAGNTATFVNAPSGGTLYGRVGNSTRVWMTGNAGDASANFQTSAISRGEIFDEPGVASALNGTSTTALTGPVEALLVRSISVPASGYVMVTGTAQVNLNHTTGTSSIANFGVSGSSVAFPTNQDVAVQVPSGAATGSYIIPTTVQGLFSVGAAGTVSFYLLGDEVVGAITVNDVQLTLAYFPTAYGTVTSTLTDEAPIPDEDSPTRNALTAAEIEAERSESRAANDSRIAAEVADLRARLAAIESELEMEEN